MFKNIKNRMWLLGIAKHQLYSNLMRADAATIKSTAGSFEKDMRAERSWPFDDPETLALYFSSWLGKQIEATQSIPKQSPAVPWTSEQWKIFTVTVPNLVRIHFRAIGKQPQQALSDDWSLGYVWGYFSSWMKELPEQTIEAGAPELYRAGFEAVFGAAGAASMTRCIEELSHTSNTSAGAAAGEAAGRDDLSRFANDRQQGCYRKSGALGWQQVNCCQPRSYRVMGKEILRRTCR